MNQATAIAPKEESEMEKRLGEVIELFNKSELTDHLEKEKQKDALEFEVQQAEEIQLQSLELLGKHPKEKVQNRQNQTKEAG